MIVEKFTENLVSCVGFHMQWTALTCHMKKCASRILFGENVTKQHMMRTMKHMTFLHLVIEKRLHKPKGTVHTYMNLIFL